MSGALESISASTKVLGVLKDVPLWLLIGVATCLLVFPYLPGARDLLSLTALSWVHIAGIFFAILAVCRLASALAPVVRMWWTRRDERRTLHLTLNDSQSYWVVTTQPDGSVVTQFTLRFMAKNRTNGRLHLLKARVIRPKIRGDVLNDLVLVRFSERNIYGTAQNNGNYIPADGLFPITATILIRGRPKQMTGRLRTVIGITDESGNETRVKFDLKGA